MPVEDYGCIDTQSNVYVDGGWTDGQNNCRCPVDQNLVEATSSFCIDDEGNWIDGGYLDHGNKCVKSEG